MLAASGTDLADLVHEESARNGPLGYLIKQLARFLHTEAVYTDNDLMSAERGAAVLAVHCPDERTKKVAWSLIAPTSPLTARYYGLGGIEHLADETNAKPAQPRGTSTKVRKIDTMQPGPSC